MQPYVERFVPSFRPRWRPFFSIANLKVLALPAHLGVLCFHARLDVAVNDRREDDDGQGQPQRYAGGERECFLRNFSLPHPFLRASTTEQASAAIQGFRINGGIRKADEGGGVLMSRTAVVV